MRSLGLSVLVLLGATCAADSSGETPPSGENAGSTTDAAPDGPELK